MDPSGKLSHDQGEQSAELRESLEIVKSASNYARHYSIVVTHQTRSGESAGNKGQTWLPWDKSAE